MIYMFVKVMLVIYDELMGMTVIIHALYTDISAVRAIP